MTTYTFQINCENAVSTVQISGDSSLHDLAEILLESIGFDLDHAFGFYSKLDGPAWGKSPDDGEHYTLFADMEDMGEDEIAGAGSVLKTSIKEVFQEGRKMLFFFDYGDAWSFIVECISVEKMAPSFRPKILTKKGTFPEQYPDYEKMIQDDDEPDNIIPINQTSDQSPATLPLFVYISGRSQKLLDLTPSELHKDSEIVLPTSNPLSLWRCEHMRSDSDGKHLFLFTHATTFFSIIVFQDELDPGSLLHQFIKKLMFQLEGFTHIPEPLQISLKMIKGNPRGLITTMNQIIYESDIAFELGFQSYETLEDQINHRYRSKECFKPKEKFSNIFKTSKPFT